MRNLLMMLTLAVSACAACGPNLAGDEGSGGSGMDKPVSPAQRDAGMLPCDETGCDTYPEPDAVVKATSCHTLLEPYGPTGTHVFLQHDVERYNSGKVVAKCRAIFGEVDYSSMVTYPDGSVTAPCSVPNDIDEQSGGSWSFGLTSDWTTSVTLYTDPSSPRHNWQNPANCWQQ